MTYTSNSAIHYPHQYFLVCRNQRNAGEDKLQDLLPCLHHHHHHPSRHTCPGSWSKRSRVWRTTNHAWLIKTSEARPVQISIRTKKEKKNHPHKWTTIKNSFFPNRIYKPLGVLYGGGLKRSHTSDLSLVHYGTS